MVVVSVPFTDTTAPMMAPALFQGILKQAGIDCVGLDINSNVFNRICDQTDYEDYLGFFYYELVTPGFESKIKSVFEYMASLILAHNPTVVCLSLLHYQCRISAKWLSFYLKKLNPELTIVIGGAGAFSTGLITDDQSYLTMMIDQQLVDHYVSGDGDVALVELIKGNVDYPGINSLSWQPLEDLNSVAYPDYDHYDMSLYKTPFIGVLGSRGCVRQCTFCDIHEYWEKFKWRTAENIFSELLFQNKKYGTQFFKFQDSLINGNVKEYNKLITLLAQHNKTHPENHLYWASYFILRPESQMSEDYWKLTAQSGAVRLNIGIESVVEKNRFHLGKKFSNQDIEFGLDMCKKYRINLAFLMLVGYPTETEQDHLETLAWFESHKHYADMPIQVVVVGGTLSVLPGTWIHRNQADLGITWKQGRPSTTAGNNSLWEIVATGNNYETRVRRLTELIDVATQNGFHVKHNAIDPQKELEMILGKKMANHE